MEQGVGNEEHEPKGGDRVGVVMEVMIGVPLIGQLIEGFVFDPPAFVAKGHDSGGRDLGER